MCIKLLDSFITNLESFVSKITQDLIYFYNRFFPKRAIHELSNEHSLFNFIMLMMINGHGRI